MSDRLYLSCWLRGFGESSMLRHFETLLTLFPFSKLAARGPVLRVYAVAMSEPPLLEREFAHTGPKPAMVESLVASASEFLMGIAAWKWKPPGICGSGTASGNWLRPR